MPDTRYNREDQGRKRKDINDGYTQGRKKQVTKVGGKKKPAPQQHKPPPGAFSDTSDEEPDDDLEEDENIGKAPESTAQPFKVVVATTLRRTGNSGTSVDTEVVTGSDVSLIATPTAFNNGRQPGRMNVEHRDEKGYKIQMEKAGYF